MGASSMTSRTNLSGQITLHGICHYFDLDCLSTGPLEGTNKKIKTMQRKVYGYRDIEFFKLKIMALHETKYALIG
jgi:transposase